VFGWRAIYQSIRKTHDCECPMSNRRRGVLLGFAVLIAIASLVALSITVRTKSQGYYTYLAETDDRECGCVFQIRVVVSEGPVRHTDPRCRIAIYRTFSENEEQHPFELRDLAIKTGDGLIVYEKERIASRERRSLVTQGTKAGIVSQWNIEHYVYIDVNIHHDGQPIEVQCTVEDDTSTCLVTKRFLAQRHRR
jgi:hypothetical protein